MLVLQRMHKSLFPSNTTYLLSTEYYIGTESH